MLIYAKKNKKRNVCKYIIVLSIIYIIFLILDIDFLPLHLNLSIGFEILFYRAFLFMAIILFIFSIVISNKKLKKLEVIENSKKDKIILLLLIIFPVIVFSFAYFREMYYINNSELILVCTSGENFSEEDFAYAINDNYCKEISIGTDFRGYKMERYLPKEFNELNYSWLTDKVEIDNNKIVIYRNDEVIYEGKLNYKISTYGLRNIFYK
jgi:amino acid transporter